MIATYVSILRRRKWLMLVVTLVLAPAAFWAMNAGPPEYESNASVLLVNDRVVDSVLGQGGGFEEPERRMATELEIFAGRVVAVQAADTLAGQGVAIDADDLAEQVEIQPLGFSRAIEVVGTAADPTLARDLTDAVVTAYLEVRQTRTELELADIDADLVDRIDDVQDQLRQLDVQLEAGAAVQASRDVAFARLEQQSQWLEEVRLLQTATDSSIEILSAASTPLEPSDRLPAPASAALALLSGLFVAAGLAILVDLGRDSVRTADEAERLVRAPVFVELQRPVRSSTARMTFLNDPGNPTMAAARALRLGLEGIGGGRVPDRVMIAEPTGVSGEGFITAAALAAACARAGQRTLLVADPVEGITWPMASRPDGSTNGGVPATDPASPLTRRTSIPNLWSLRATSQPGERATGLLDGYALGPALEALAADFELVVIVPPAEASVFELIMLRRFVDVAALVCTLDRTTGHRLRQVAQTMASNDASVDGLIVTTRPSSGASRPPAWVAEPSTPPPFQRTEGGRNGAGRTGAGQTGAGPRHA